MYDDYDEIRSKAEERVRKRDAAKEGLIAFLLVDGFFWIAWTIARLTGVGDDVTTPSFWILLVISAIWGFIAIGSWYDDVYAAEKREASFRKKVEAEIQRELDRRALTEKRKRLVLSDDGELVEAFEEESSPPANQSSEVR